MTTSFVPSTSITSPDRLILLAAVSAYLGRYRGDSRLHTESDLRIFLTWCTEQNLEPLSAVRADIERYVRWLQDVRRFQPSTVSRRLSVVVGFYRVCVIDAIRESDEKITEEQKATLDALHLRKIDLADRVLVINPGGYIGESTSREIAYARATGKPVSFTDPV